VKGGIQLPEIRFLDKPFKNYKRTRYTLNELAEDYLEENKEEFRGASNLQEIHDMVALAVPTVHQYLIRYQDNEKETEWIEAERRIEIPYAYPDGKETVVKGYIDLIGKARTSYKIQDTKTTGRVDIRAFKNAQPFSLQLNIYCLGFLFEYGKLPNQIIYDVVRRAGTKKKQTEKISDWIARIELEIKSKPDHYFKRAIHNVDESEFNNWLNQEFHPIMEDVRKWEEASYECYPNPTAFYYDQSPSPFLDAILYNDFSKLKNRKNDNETERAKSSAYSLLQDL
jgi:hypothetical protein